MKRHAQHHGDRVTVSGVPAASPPLKLLYLPNYNPTMSLDTPKYLAELFSTIRGRSIAWDAQVRAGLISDSDVKKFKAIDKVSKEKQVGAVEKDVDGYALLVLGPQGALKGATDGERMDVVAYMLVLLGDLLEGLLPWSFFSVFWGSVYV